LAASVFQLRIRKENKNVFRKTNFDAIRDSKFFFAKIEKEKRKKNLPYCKKAVVFDFKFIFQRL
jgi:hypothetical protein